MAASPVVVFDAYGTLFDVTAASRRAAAADPTLAEAEAELSRIWREKQIGYSWWRTVTGTYVPFWQVTQDALDYALEATGLSGDDALRGTLLDLYRELDAYAEVPGVLSALRAAGNPTAILSNGSEDMLSAAVSAAELSNAFDAVMSVEDLGTFKPAAEVYAMVGARFATEPGDVLFVSSNGWDIAGAAHFGFRTAWVNRAGLPEDRLPARPHKTLTDLTTLPELAAAP